MKIKTTMFKIKFKNKIPCDDEFKLGSDLAYYLPFLAELTEEVMNWDLSDIKEHTRQSKEEFDPLSREYSNLFKEYAQIKLRANELYYRNRVVALTMGLLRQKLMRLKSSNVALPLDYDKAIEKVEYFIYRYITKKQDDRLVEQVVFDER